MEKITTATIRKMKKQNERVAALTAYDYPTACLVDEVGMDIILVGDSVSNVVLGYEDTLAVTVEEMLHHTRAVARGTKRALVVGDMPFMSYQADVEDAVRNAGRFLKEGNSEAVKVEGGRGMVDKVEAILDAGIPVMGHLGLTPQWIHRFGGYKVQGKTSETARRIMEDAKELEEAGVFSIVLESIPRELAKMVTEEVKVPTIGCGAGPHCDGQVLVLHDMLGLSEISPKFVKQYGDLDSSIEKALENYLNEVKSGKFPTSKYSYKMEDEELEKLSNSLEKNS